MKMEIYEKIRFASDLLERNSINEAFEKGKYG